MQDRTNDLLDYFGIVDKLTVDDMLHLTTRVTPGPKGEPEKGFGVEVVAKCTGLPVAVTLDVFHALAAAADLSNKYDGLYHRCTMHRPNRRYAAVLEPWKCTCGYVFWHNLQFHAIKADVNEKTARNSEALSELVEVLVEMKDELREMREAS